MKKSTPYQLILESLEERVFFDANPAAAIVEPTDGGVEEVTPDGAQMQAESEADTAVEEETSTETAGQESDGDQQAAEELSDTESAEESMMDTEADESGVTEAVTDDADTQSVASEDVVIPIDPLIGEDFTFAVSFENTTTSTVYGPYIDLILDGGQDGSDSSDDGISFNGATYLGAEIQYVSQTVDATGTITHAYATDASGDPLVITGLDEGDEFVSLLMPFGSFTVDQTPADVVVSAHMSENADIDTALTVDVVTGAMYGTDALDNPTTDSPLRGDTDGLETSVQSFMPEVLAFNTDINVSGVDADCQEQHGSESDSRNVEDNHQEIPTGPNYPFEYISTIDIADGQEVGGQTVDGRTGLLYTQHVPTSVNYLGVTSVVDSTGSAIAYTIVSEPTGTSGGDLILQLDSEVVGTTDTDDIVITYEAYVPEQTGDTTPVDIIDPLTGDDAHITNDGEIEFLWNPIDTNDSQVIATVDAEVDIDGNFSETPDIDDISHAEAITIQKSHRLTTDAGYSGYTPGDTVEFTLDFQISDYFAFGDSDTTDSDTTFGIVDTVYNGLLLEDDIGGAYQPVISIYEDGVLLGTSTLTEGSEGDELWVTTGDNGDLLYHYNLAEILDAMGDDGILSGGESGGTGDGATYGTITYQTTIQQLYAAGYNFEPDAEFNVDQGDILQAGGTTDVEIFGEIYEEDGASPGFTGESEADESCDSLSVVTGSVEKEIYAINGETDSDLWETDDEGRPRISPGDTVSYHLSYVMPISSTEDFQLTDYLPLPVFDVDDPDADGVDSGWTQTADGVESLAAGEWYFTADHTYEGTFDTSSVDSDNNALVLSWEEFHDDDDSEGKVDVVFTIAVDDAEFADGLFLTNQVTATEQGTPLASSDSNDIIQIVLDEPVLEITKGVVATDNSDSSFDATVGAVTFTDPGSTGVRWNTGTEEIDESGLDTTPIDANLDNIDAGDTVTFAIVIENTGHSDAYDIEIDDDLPDGFAIPSTAEGLNLSVTDGAGNAIAYTISGAGTEAAFFTDGIELTDVDGGAIKANSDDDTSQTDNILIITYDLVALETVEPESVITNTASISNYAGRDGGTSFDTTDLSDTAAVTVDSPSVTKSIVSTSQTHTADSDVAVGEIVTYEVTIEVQEGTTSSVSFEDHLDSGLALVSVDSIVASSVDLSTSQGTWADVLASLIVTNDGEDFTLDFGDIVNSNTDNDTAETITITYQAVATNVASNSRGADLENDAEWYTGATELATANESVNVVEPILNVTKTVSDSTPDSNDLVTFTIVVTNPNNGNGADAFEVSLSDVVPDGYTYETSTWILFSGLAPTTITADEDGDLTEGDLAATWTTFAEGATATLTFQARVGTVTAGQDLTNTVNIDWSSLPGDETSAQSIYNTVSTERTGDTSDLGGATNDHSDSDDATVIVTGSIDKQDLTPTSYTIGDTVSYDIVVTLPEADIDDLMIIDTLPVGLVYDSHSIDLGTFASDIDLGTMVVDAAAGDGNDITFTFDDFTVTADNDTGTDSFTITVNVLVEDVASNYDGVDLVNEVSMTYLDPDANTVTVEDPTDPEISIVEPWILTSKTVTATSGVEAGDTVTYTVTLTNDGNSAAYEVNFFDSLAQGTLFGTVTSATIDGVDVSLGTTGDPNGDGSVISFSDPAWDLAVDSVLVVTYTATVTDAAIVDGAHTNSVDADWSGKDGTVAGERVYDEDDGIDSAVDDGTNADRDVDDATFTMPGVTIDKSDGGTTEATIGDVITYTLTIDAPLGTVSNLNVEDVLSAGLIYNGDAEISYDSGVTFSSYDSTAAIPSNDGSSDVTLAWAMGDTVVTTEDTIVIRYTATVADVTDNYDGEATPNLLDNSVTLTYDNVDGEEQTDSDVDDFTIVEPWILTDKTVVASSGVEAGDTVTYTVTLTNDGNAAAYEVNFFDSLAQGTSFGSVTSATIDGVDVSLGTTGDPNGDGSVISFSDPAWDLAVDSVLVVTYTASVTDAAIVDGAHTNSVDADWSGKDGTVAGERVYDEDDGIDSAVDDGTNADRDVDDATFTMPEVTIDKSDGGTTEATIGDVITYTLTIDAPQGTVSNLNVEDVLSAGLIYNGDAQLSINGGGFVDYDPAAVVTNDGSTDVTLAWAMGDTIVTTEDTIVIRYTATVADVTGNFDGGASPNELDNAVTLTYDDVTDTEQTDTDVDDFTIVEPQITTTKSVVDTSGDGFAQPGEILTYTVILENTGNSIAYETIAVDTLAAGVEFKELVSVTGGATVSATYDDMAGTVTFGTLTSDTDNWDIAVGAQVEIVYTVTVMSAGFTSADIENTVNANWSGMDGTSLQDEERDYDDTNSYAVDGDQDVDDASIPTRLSGSLGNYVYFDSDGSGGDFDSAGGDVGISGVDVTITADVDGDGTFEYENTTTTAADGYYIFENLATYDDYVITVDYTGVGGGFGLAGAGYTQTYDNDEGTVALDHIATSIAITDAAPDRTDNNFGYTGSQSIGNLVWYDGNADGVQPDVDSNEAGLGGVTVELRADIDGDSDYEYVATTTTANDGSYQFSNLPAGAYTLSIIPDVASWFDSGVSLESTWDYDDQGAGIDANTDDIASFDLAASGGNYEIDFGVRGNASVSEWVFFDVNNSGGDYEPGVDLGIGGVDVSLSGDVDGDGNPDYTLTTTTADDGSYSFGTLLPGEYTITVDTDVVDGFPEGMEQVYDAGDVSFDDSHTLTLADGDDISTVNFGYIGDGSIEEYVWWDGNDNALKDANEVGLAGVELQLTGDFDGDGTDEIIGTTTTDADGNYIFDYLPALDSYTVTILSGIQASATATYDLDGTDSLMTTNYSLGYNDLTGEVEQTTLVNFGFNGEGVIGDTVWLDANNDGVFDSGAESGLAGVTVTLSADLDGLNGDEEFVVTTQTDADGNYFFDGLFTSAAGINYTVTVDDTTLPASANLTHDFDDTADASLTEGTPGSAVVTLTNAAPEELDADFGYDIFSTIGDRVWLDNDGDGVQDTDEIGLAGITVTLLDDMGGLVDTAVTDADGAYLFTDLTAGEYTVETSNLPEGVTQTFDVDGVITADSATVTLGTGETNVAVDFGYQATGSIGDTIWNNIDGDTTDNGGTEPGIAGVTVTLTGDFNNDGTVEADETRTVVTDADGNYLFENLIAGDYTVEVFDLPVGMVQNYDPEGATDNSANVTLGGTEDMTTDLIDFGYEQTAAIGDRVWFDLNGDGVQDASEFGLGGITVTLYDDTDTQVAQMDTDSDGNYLFTGLTPDDYYVVVDSADLPTGMVQTWDRDDTDPSGTFDTPHSSDVITLGAEETVLDVDFGYSGSGAIGEVIWEDVNGDTIHDGTEPGIAGVTVTVTGDFNNDGDLDDPEDIMTTATDADGNYSFTNLPEGPYTVTVDTTTLPPGMLQTTDDDGLETPHTVTDTLSGLTNNNFNFGYQQFSAIGDYVWYDIDGDGVQDAGELPLENVQVTLAGDFDDDGDTDSLTITTDENGYYLFDSHLITSNIASGDYTVSVALPATLQGTEQTYDSDGLATPNSSDLTIAEGEVDFDQDFGFRGTGSIGDTVWYDLDEDGVVDAGEEGIAGVKVTLEGDFDGDGVTDMVLETTTDANGKYSFDYLFAGEYTITSDPSTVTSNYYQVYDSDDTLDNQTTIQLGAGEVNNSVDFGYRPLFVPQPSVVPPEPPVVPPVPPTPEVAIPYDPLFRSYVEDGESRDVQDWIDERREEPVFKEPLLPVSPIYTGHAEPGTTLFINLTDAQGNFVGSQLVMADTGGNWLANFSGSLMYDMPHNIEIQQDMSLYNASSAGGFNLRTYFMPALSTSPFTMSELTIDSIFATRPFAIMEALGEHYNRSTGLGWNDFYDYEYKAVSTNPSQSTL